MGLIERLAVRLVSRYLPGVDGDALRVDLAHQRVTLAAIDLAEAAPACMLVAGVPFRLDGRSCLRRLDLNYSAHEAQLNVEGLDIAMIEIPFSSHDTDAFAAARDASIRRKKAMLARAEGGKATGTLPSKLFERFAPSFLRGLDILLTDVSLSFATAKGVTLTLSVDHASSAPLNADDPDSQGSGPTSRRNLRRRYILRGISISLEGHFRVDIPECVFSLGYEDEQYSLSLQFERCTRVEVKDTFPQPLLGLSAEAELWSRALRNRRPTLRPSAAICAAHGSSVARSWWSYAARCVAPTLAHLSSEQTDSIQYGLAGLRQASEYKSLHIERLRSGRRVRAAVTRRCEEIETQLDVETIVLLRAKARVDVHAPDAFRFATSDALRWLLAGTTESTEELDGVTDEVRTVLGTLKRAERDDQELDAALSTLGMHPGPALNWSSVKIGVDFSRAELVCESVEDDLSLKTRLSQVSATVVLNSDMIPISARLAVQDISVDDGRASFAERMAPLQDALSQENDPAVTLFLSRLKEDTADLHVDVRLAPLRLHLDFCSLSPLLRVARASSRAFAATNAQGQRNPTAHPQAGCVRSIRVNMAMLVMVVSSGLCIRDAECKFRDAVVFTLSEADLHAKSDASLPGTQSCLTAAAVPPPVVQGSVALEIRSAIAANDSSADAVAAQSAAPAGAHCNFVRFAVGDVPLLVSEVVLGNSEEFATDIKIPRLEMNFVDDEAVALFVLFRCLAEEAEEELDAAGLLTASGSRNSRHDVSFTDPSSSKNGASLDARHSFPSRTMSAANKHQSNEYSWVSKTLETFCICVPRLQFTLREGAETLRTVVLAVSADNVILSSAPDPGHHLSIGRCVGRASGGSDFFRIEGNGRPAVDVLYQTSDDTAHSDLSAALDSLHLSLTPDHLTTVLPVIARIEAIFSARGTRKASEPGTQRSDSSAVPLSVNVAATIAEVHCRVRVEPLACDLRLSQLRTQKGDGYANGSVRTLELVDVSGRSGIYSTVLSKRSRGESGTETAPSLRFIVSGSDLEVSVDGLQCTVLRSFIEDVRTALADADSLSAKIANAAQRTLHDIDAADESDSDASVDYEQPNSHANEQLHTLSIAGSHVFIVIPASPSDVSAIGLDLHKVTIAVAPLSLAINAQRIRLLVSRPARQRSAQSSSQRADWALVATSLDADISRSQSTIGSSASSSTQSAASRSTDEWVISFQSKALILSREQVDVFVGIFAGNLLKPKHPDTIDYDGEQSDSRIRSGSLPQVASPEGPEGASSFHTLSVSVLTPGISIELLGRDCEGEAPNMGLASVTLSQMRVAVQSVTKRNANKEVSSRMSRWLVDLEHTQLEDRRGATADAFRLALSVDGVLSDAQQAESESRPGAVRMQAHIHQEAGSTPEMRVDLQICRLRALWKPDFVEELIAFASVAKSTSVPSTASTVSSVDSSSSSISSADVDVKYPATDMNGGSGVSFEQSDEALTSAIVSKIVLVVESSQLFAVETPMSERSRGVEFACKRTKLSLLLTGAGTPAAESFLRLRGIEVSMHMAPPSYGPAVLRTGVSSAAGSQKSGTSNVSTRRPTNDVHTNGGPRPSNRLHEAPGGGPEGLVERACALRAWADGLVSHSVLLGARSVLITLPHDGLAELDAVNAIPGISRLDVAVGAVESSGIPQDFASFVLLCDRLFLATDSGETSAPTPQLDISLKDFRFEIRIPHQRTANEARLRRRGDGSSAICGSLSATINVGRGAENVYVDFDLYDVESFDGTDGEWDLEKLLESCSASFSYAATTGSGRLVAQDPVKVKLSPGSLRSLILAYYSVQDVFSRPEDRSAQPVAGSRDTHARALLETRDAEARTIVEAHAAQLEVALLSENLRLRVLAVDNQCLIYAPTVPRARTQVYLAVGSFRVVNETAGAWTDSDERDWSLLLSPAPRLVSLSERPGFSRALQRARDLLGDRIDRSRLLGGHLHATGRPLVARNRPSRPPSTEDERHGRNDMGCSQDHERSYGGELSNQPQLRTNGTLATANTEDRRQSMDPRTQPTVVAVMSTGDIMDGLQARLGVSGLDIGLDATIIPELELWAQMVRNTIAEASQFSTRASHAVTHVQHRYSHVAVEGIGLRVSVRAPQMHPSARSGLATRLLERGLGSETVTDLLLHIPRVERERTVRSPREAATLISSEYARVLRSSNTLLQIISQVSRMSRLVRVLLLTYLRLRTAPRRDRLRHRRRDGLLAGTDDGTCARRVASGIYEQTTMPGSSLPSRSGDGPPVPHPGLGPGSRPRANGRSSPRAQSRLRAEGQTLFARLYETDRELNLSGDEFRYYVPHTQDAAVLVTSNQVLLIDRARETIIEPRLKVTQIEKYTVENATTLVIHCARPTANVSQVLSRDTVSMLKTFGSVTTYSIQCDTRTTAAWLRDNLPTMRKASGVVEQRRT